MPPNPSHELLESAVRDDIYFIGIMLSVEGKLGWLTVVWFSEFLATFLLTTTACRILVR
jgi:hypothetical protein